MPQSLSAQQSKAPLLAKDARNGAPAFSRKPSGWEAGYLSELHQYEIYGTVTFAVAVNVVPPLV